MRAVCATPAGSSVRSPFSRRGNQRGRCPVTASQPGSGRLGPGPQAGCRPPPSPAVPARLCVSAHSWRPVCREKALRAKSGSQAGTLRTQTWRELWSGGSPRPWGPLGRSEGLPKDRPPMPRCPATHASLTCRFHGDQPRRLLHLGAAAGRRPGLPAGPPPVRAPREEAARRPGESQGGHCPSIPATPGSGDSPSPSPGLRQEVPSSSTIGTEGGLDCEVESVACSRPRCHAPRVVPAPTRDPVPV